MTQTDIGCCFQCDSLNRWAVLECLSVVYSCRSRDRTIQVSQAQQASDEPPRKRGSLWISASPISRSMLRSMSCGERVRSSRSSRRCLICSFISFAIAIELSAKKRLIDVVWQGRFISEAALSSRVFSARRAIGDNGDDQLFIRTHQKRGFRFVGRVDNPVRPSDTLP